MKTPEEIKKGLETCIGECTGNKPHCPYHECGNGCMDSMNRDAIAYIRQLESRLAQVEREKDAVVECITNVLKAINKPVNRTVDLENNIMDARSVVLCWAENWRGVCAENSKEKKC